MAKIKKKATSSEFIFVNEVNCEAYTGMIGGSFVFSGDFSKAKVFDDINQIYYLTRMYKNSSILHL
jgi:hypothetical protein